ncbi:MAG TPA: tetratricopeptide repeat protein [Candidatus Faecaligallichristensenella faecipullorum]|nr:tetratricopeptide repeat protein [Candidatus Faecaligallichristensenella faecipullorum]
MLLQAQQLEHARKWAQAWPLYLQAYEQQGDLDALAQAAWCASLAKEFDCSAKLYMRLSELQPDEPRWAQSVGYQMASQKHTREAVKWFERAIQLDPNYFVAHYRLGNAFVRLLGDYQPYRQKEFYQALNQFNRCGALYASMDAPEQAEHKAIYKKSCFQKGKLLLESHQWEQAAQCFTRAKSLSDKPDADCDYNLALIAYQKGDYEQALSALPPVDNRFYISELHGDILWKLNQREEAFRLIRLAAKQRNSDALNRKLASMYYAAQDYEQAFQWAQRALRINPRNHKNHLGMAMVCEKLGFLDKAESEAAQAVELKQSQYASAYPKAQNLLEDIRAQKLLNGYPGDDTGRLVALSAENARQQGVVERYDPERRFGFIQTENARYFFHYNQVERESRDRIHPGVKVDFEVGANDQGSCAVQVHVCFL